MQADDWENALKAIGEKEEGERTEVGGESPLVIFRYDACQRREEKREDWVRKSQATAQLWESLGWAKEASQDKDYSLEGSHIK